MSTSFNRKTVQEPDFIVPSSPLPLVDAIKIALQNNPEIEMAVARINQSEALIDEATASFWPVISTFMEYIQGDAPSAFLFKTMDQRKLQQGVNFNDPGWFENYEIGLKATINLYNGGRDLLRKRMAETGLEIYELDYQSVENALIASVIGGYFNALAANDFIEIAKESVTTVEKQLRIMRVRYEEGGALKSDVLSLEVRLAQAREDLVRARNNYMLSIAALSNLLGLHPNVALSCKKGEETPLELPPDYESGIVHALANRPELQKVRLQIIQSRMGLDVARAGYIPRLDAQSRVYYDDPDFDFSDDRRNWTAGVILNWDLFSGFSTRAHVAKERAILEEMIAADRKTTQAVQLDLKTAYLKMAESEARLEVTKASVAQADETLRLVKKQYEGGSASITRYLDAELTRNKAKIRTAAALYDLQKAKAAVGRALGIWAIFAEGVHDKYE
ncbi:MAG: TolC family protein [Thermodesulfobacteriota bacterium]|nr:TolC family protein [Thermodesulfobacteriota bacterium]